MDIRRRFTYDYNSNFGDDSCPTNEIWYTSSNNNVVKPYKTNVFGATIKSNTYRNGKGVITFNGDVTTIGDYAFSNCDSLTSVTIPDSVITIGDYAFKDCSTSFTHVTIGNGVTTIGEGAFWYCKRLTSVTIPDSVTTIGEAAFELCSSLTSVTIPDNVWIIGRQAFGSCGSLTSVYCKPTTPPAGGVDMFSSNVSGRKIYVPMESVEAYKSASYWSSYADDIVGYEF